MEATGTLPRPVPEPAAPGDVLVGDGYTEGVLWGCVLTRTAVRTRLRRGCRRLRCAMPTSCATGGCLSTPAQSRPAGSTR